MFPANQSIEYPILLVYHSYPINIRYNYLSILHPLYIHHTSTLSRLYFFIIHPLSSITSPYCLNLEDWRVQGLGMLLFISLMAVEVRMKQGSFKWIWVSWNGGTPKWSILMGCSIRNHLLWGTPMTMETNISSKIWPFHRDFVMIHQRIYIVVYFQSDSNSNTDLKANSPLTCLGYMIRWLDDIRWIISPKKTYRCWTSGDESGRSMLSTLTRGHRLVNSRSQPAWWWFVPLIWGFP